jgi:integrase
MRQRSNDSWQLRVYLGYVDGRRRFATRTVRGTRREAEAALAAFQVEANTGQAAPSARGTVGAFLDEWFEAFAGDWSPTTQATVRGAIDLYLRPVLGDRRLTRLATADIDRLYGRLRRAGKAGAPLAAGTITRIHGVLHASLEQAVRWGRISVNPASKARPPRVVAGELSPPSPADVRRLLAAADGPFAVCLRVLAATGARRGEVCGLQWSDLDTELGELHIRRRVVLGDGELVVVPLTKNRKTRHVALDPATIAVLNQHRLAMRQRAETCGARLGKDAFMFSDDPACRHPWRPDNGITRRFMRLRDQLGLPGVRLHDLRHAAATQLLVAGVDVRTAAERLGHDPRTMLSVYAHPVREADQRAATLMGDLLDDPRPVDNSDRNS